MKMRIGIAAVFAALVSISAAPQAGAHVPGASLTGQGSPTIDGVMAAGEWDGAGRLDFAAAVPSNDGGGTTPATLFVMNDESNLYIGLSVLRQGAPRGSFSIEFDNDHDGIFFEEGDDGFVANPGVFYTDFFRTTLPPCPAGAVCGLLDAQLGGTSDGQSASAGSGGVIVYEVSKPLDSADDLHDFSLASGDTIGFSASIQLWSVVPACNFGPQCVADTNVPTLGGGDIIVAASDTTPPVIAVPADLEAEATSPDGANVTYTVSAEDDSDGPVPVTCEPPSGSPFAIGDTVVNCGATDAAGNEATASFTVHVKGAAEQVADLIALVDSYSLRQLGAALHDKLVKVQQFLAANKPKRACEKLDAFLAQVKEQWGKRLPVEQADRLTTDVRRIRAVIGC